MHFVDECRFRVEAGDGGDGAVAFRRERFIPNGGPSGGDGGRGGSVYMAADPGMTTLYDFHRQAVYRAKPGENGQGRDCYGAAAEDLTLRVPLGTVVFDAETKAVIAELLAPGDRVCIARGGRGGKGNKHFATPSDRAPRRAEPGGRGRSSRSAAGAQGDGRRRPLGLPQRRQEHLCQRRQPRPAQGRGLSVHHPPASSGRGELDNERSFVVADLPGLVEGASEGVGLGLRFLRHVERTRLLLHLVTLSPDPARNPLSDYEIVRAELLRYNPKLAERPELVVLSQADLPDVRDAWPGLKAAFAERFGVDLLIVSAATHWQLDELRSTIAQRLPPREAIERSTVVPRLARIDGE